MIKVIDIICDLSFGDTGKREISYSLNKSSKYTHSMRVNGGSNSGGTVHYELNGTKGVFKLSQVPTGIFHGKTCIIGNGCVINLSKLHKEIRELENIGISCKDKLFIARNAHIVMSDHILEEEREGKIGTTKQGIGPCYRDKYNRTGYRMEDIFKEYVSQKGEIDRLWCEGVDIEYFKPMVIDLYNYLYSPNEEISILVECAQGFYLDIDNGEYPFVTSSHTTVAGALLNCLPWNKIDKVYGCIKAYDTYVETKKFQPDDEIFNKLGDLGMEYGVITGRRRQCNWLDMDGLIKAARINAVTHLVVSKLDILRELNFQEKDQYWKVRDSQGWTLDCSNVDDFIQFIENALYDNCGMYFENIQFKYGPEDEIMI